MILNFLELWFLKANLGKNENWWSWCNYDWIGHKWLKSMHKLKENFNVPWRVKAGHFFRKMRNKEHHESLRSCVCLVEIDVLMTN